MRPKIHLPVGLVDGLTSCKESLLTLHCDWDKVDEAVIADEASQGLIEEFVLLCEVVLGKSVNEVFQVQHISVVVQAKLQLPILFNKINLKQ